MITGGPFRAPIDRPATGKRAFLVERRRDLAKGYGGIVLIAGGRRNRQIAARPRVLDATGSGSRAGRDRSAARQYCRTPVRKRSSKLLAGFAPESAYVAPAASQDEQTRCARGKALLAASRKHALGRIVEDLHWGDLGTMLVLAYFAERIPRRARILIVATYRSHELQGPIIHYSFPSRISCGALSVAQMQACAADGTTKQAGFITAAWKNVEISPDARPRTSPGVAEGNSLLFSRRLAASTLPARGVGARSLRPICPRPSAGRSTNVSTRLEADDRGDPHGKGPVIGPPL